ncbi:MAG: protein-export chaperone SecB [Magnetococcales bacterium]|nr:protein-export chaperone SecB [Magnetococcales bacterium]
MAEESNAVEGAEPDTNTPIFHVEKLYLKDLSFESPHAPEVFRDGKEPKVEFNLDTAARKKEDDHYEVALNVTVKVTNEDRPLFLVEVVYGGLFLLKNFSKDHIPMMLGIECPSVLFPYVRQVVSQTITDGGFKPLVLEPINFAMLYHQAQAKRKAQADENADGDVA